MVHYKVLLFHLGFPLSVTFAEEFATAAEHFSLLPKIYDDKIKGCKNLWTEIKFHNFENDLLVGSITELLNSYNKRNRSTNQKSLNYCLY